VEIGSVASKDFWFMLDGHTDIRIDNDRHQVMATAQVVVIIQSSELNQSINQCLSPVKLWVQFPSTWTMTRFTRYKNYEITLVWDLWQVGVSLYMYVVQSFVLNYDAHYDSYKIMW
jgi:hypothetical protein